MPEHNVKFLGEASTWPMPATLGFEVLNYDGDVAQLLQREGPWEVELIWRDANEDGQHLLVALGFPTKQAGDEAAEILADAFKKVNELAAGDRPDPETCEHEIEPMRFSRKMNPVRKCRKCLKEFGEVELARA